MKRIIEKKIALLVGLILLSSSLLHAQLSEEVEKITPELPGEIMVDFGFNYAIGDDETSFFNSRSLAIYFVKPIELNKKIEFRPGIGWNTEKFAVKKSVLDDISDPTVVNTSTEIEIKDLKLALNYVDIPIVFRYNFKGNNSRGMFFEIGGTAAFLLEAHAKMKFKDEEGDLLKMRLRSKPDVINLKRFRYGAQARFGIGSFSLFYKHYFSDLSSVDSGSYFTGGISLSGF